MSSIWITVPIGQREEYIPGLLAGLTNYYNQIVFINNHPDYTRHKGHHVKDFGPTNIYRWWNTGINYAQQYGATHVAVLNDDLEFDTGFIPAMHEHLTKHDQAIVDTGDSGNGGGAAWMMDLKYNLRLDERFQWWYGDTELFDRTRAIGKFGRFTYPGFTHHKPNGNLIEHPELQALVAQDAELYGSLNA